MKKITGIGLNVLKIAIVLAGLVIVLWGLTRRFERKDSINKYSDFFEEKQNFDVLFLGSSHAINGVFPMQLWNDYGIVSYNLGGHSNVMATNYWVLQNALDYTTPKLVVIDCMDMEANEKTSGFISYVHLSLDAFKPSITKYRAVKDLLNDDIMNERIAIGDISDNGEERTILGMLWDYSVYHSRWKELTQDDFGSIPSPEKGAEARVRVSVPANSYHIPEDQKFENTVSMDYLRRTISECQARGIEVLLINIPFPANTIQQMAANSVSDIAAEMNVNHINFLNMDFVNYDTDCYDPDSHLNPSGARKITDYLGAYITDNYDIPDRRNDIAYAGWNEDYMNYRFFMLEKILLEEQLDNYLMLVSDPNYKVIVELKDESLMNVSPYGQLLDNIGAQDYGNGILANYEPAELPAATRDGYMVRVILSDSESGSYIDDSYWYYDGYEYVESEYSESEDEEPDLRLVLTNVKVERN